MKVVWVLSVFVIGLSLVTTSTGLLSRSGSGPHFFKNQFGEQVLMDGYGVYANDSLFMASISRGTDFGMLFVCIPALAIALYLDFRKRTVRHHLVLLSMLSVFLYYGASISLGLAYNYLHLVYTSLFSAAFFAFVAGIVQLQLEFPYLTHGRLSHPGVNIFLILTSVALFVAWLPDILTSLVNKKSLELIEIYTTQITYVIDMGIIAPAAFVTYWLLNRRSWYGYVFAPILLIMSAAIGIIVLCQTLFQIGAGIDLPFVAWITKVSIFVLMAGFAIYLVVPFVGGLGSREEQS